MGWAIARDTANVHLSMAKMQQYEEAFNSIKMGTNLNNIDQLVDEFVQAEYLNTSLNVYVDQLKGELGTLQQEISDISDELKRYQGHGVNNENNRAGIIDKLTQELNETEREMKDQETQYIEVMKTLNALRVGVHSIFNKTGFKTDEVSTLIGSTGVTESNMLQYLGFIEKITDEMIEQYAVKQPKEGLDQPHQQESSQAIQRNNNQGKETKKGTKKGEEVPYQMEIPDHDFWKENVEKDRELIDDVNNLDSKVFFQKYQNKLAEQDLIKKKTKTNTKNTSENMSKQN